MMSIREKILNLSNLYRNAMKQKIEARVEEMKEDDNSHSLVYQVLGVSHKEGQDIDVYQNKGRFLYKYAGSFLEKATQLCFLEAFPSSGSIRITNTVSSSPKTFEIDCLVGSDAIEIKWRDATTDGDHIKKEHNRMQCIAAAGYKPIRIMFFYPNRASAIKIQQKLQSLYEEAGGEYYFGEDAWNYVNQRTNINLIELITEVAVDNVITESIKNIVKLHGNVILSDNTQLIQMILASTDATDHDLLAEKNIYERVDVLKKQLYDEQ